MGNHGPPTKRDMGVFGERACRGVKECLHERDEFSNEGECAVEGFDAWVQEGAGNGDGGTGSKYVAAVGRDIP